MTIIVTGNGGQAGRGSLSPSDAGGIALLAPGSKTTITGGIAMYRGTISPSRVGSLQNATGLPAGTSQLTCVGSASPIPDWQSDVGSPDECLDGSVGLPGRTAAPQVAVWAPGFRAPSSLRATLQVNGIYLHGWAIAPSATHSIGMHGESGIDLNLKRDPVFTLSREANRAIFAEEPAIVPATGLFASQASRIDPAFGRVTQAVSDLKYHATQFTLPIVSPKFMGGLQGYLVYSLNLQRMQQRGFSGTTASDPRKVEWVSGRQPKHQVTMGIGNIRAWWLTLTPRIDILSGAPYTPIVAHDINADGSVNDRAFVANPATALPLLAEEMTTLLASAPSQARRCLEQQLGTIAAGNSCRTPWQARFDINIQFTPPASIGDGSRFRVRAAMLNAGGALVRLAGLQNTLLGQTSAGSAADPRLLYVTGYTPATHQFTYRVNQLFGSPIDFGNARHRYPPFQVQLGLEYRLGYPPTHPRHVALDWWPP